MYKLIVDTSDTYYLNNINKDINTLVTMHDNILDKRIIGKSVEGRELFLLKMSVGTLKYKPSILFVGGIHAREDYSVMLVMKMLDYFCYHYNKNIKFEGFDIRKLLDKIDLFFYPVANPDGLNIVHHGIEASLNYNKVKKMPLVSGKDEYWKANANGVDINKNFNDGNWDKRKSKPEMDMPCSEGYKGDKPNSEPETKALIEMSKEFQFTIIVSYHCTGNVTFWADSGTHEVFNGIDEDIIDKFVDRYIYRKTKVSQDPSWYGCGFENWYRSFYHRIGLCIELSPFSSPQQHPDSKFDELVWDYAKSTGLYLAKEAFKTSKNMYDVKVDDKLIKTYYDKSQAIDFARHIDNSYVFFCGRIIWSNIEKYAAIDKD